MTSWQYAAQEWKLTITSSTSPDPDMFALHITDSRSHVHSSFSSVVSQVLDFNCFLYAVSVHQLQICLGLETCNARKEKESRGLIRCQA